MSRLRLFVALSLVATSAHATLDEPVTSTYRGLCHMTQTCTADGACGTTPSVGDLMLVIDGTATWMGQTDTDLAPVDRYATLQGALPLPPMAARRTFLTDLPPEGSARRFAVRIQTADPATGAPRLRPQYFVLSCVAL